MTRLRILALSATSIVLIAATSVSVFAQASESSGKSRSVSVSIELDKDRIAAGKKPWAIVTMKNISRHDAVCLSTSPDLFRIHVSGSDGEPPLTEWHRHLRGDVRPGDGPDTPAGPVTCRPIAPKASDFEGFDLSQYYDLRAAGKYSVYLEVYDPLGPPDGSGLWLRTNTVQFEIVPPKQ
jgi:hypothetical protein